MNSGNTDCWVWIDEQIRRPGEATIDAFDHGFLYGDSIYETLRSHGGRPFAVAKHLERMQRSAAAIDLALPRDAAGLRAVVEATLAARPAGKEAGVRLVVTRGIGPLGLDISHCTSPRLLAYGWPVEPGLHPYAVDGVSIVVSSVRRNPPSALNPHIKSGNFLNNILAYREAKAAGAYEALLLTVDDTIAEATTSNLFWVRDGRVYSADDEGILLGVTRATLLELFAEAGIDCELGRYRLESLYAADEVFLTSTLKGVLPVVRVDERTVSNGKPGALTRRIAELYDARVNAM